MTFSMKNKIFGRVAAFLIILFCFTEKAFAQIHFEVTPLYELKNGCLNELVFAIFDDDVYKLSELNWNIKNISYIGGKVGVSYKWFEFESSMMGAFSKKSAKMYDSDWQDLPANPEMKTTFSISENTLNHNFTFDSKAIFAPDITDWFKTGIFLQYTLDQIQFSARNGYGWYGSSRYSQNGQYVPFDSEYAKFFATGSLQGIDYYRVTRSFNLGLLFNFTIFERLQIKLEGTVSPYTFVQSLDHHYSASSAESYYRDEIKSHFAFYNFGTELKFRVIENIYAGCGFSYYYMKERQGDTYSKQETHGYTDMIFKDLNEYYPDSSSLSGTSAKWYTLTAFCSFIF